MRRNQAASLIQYAERLREDKLHGALSGSRAFKALSKIQQQLFIQGLPPRFWEEDFEGVPDHRALMHAIIEIHRWVPGYANTRDMLTLIKLIEEIACVHERWWAAFAKRWEPIVARQIRLLEKSIRLFSKAPHVAEPSNDFVNAATRCLVELRAYHDALSRLAVELKPLLNPTKDPALRELRRTLVSVLVGKREMPNRRAAILIHRVLVAVFPQKAKDFREENIRRHVYHDLRELRGG